MNTPDSTSVYSRKGGTAGERKGVAAGTEGMQKLLKFLYDVVFRSLNITRVYRMKTIARVICLEKRRTSEKEAKKTHQTA